jgi:hypothetical protein
MPAFYSYHTTRFKRRAARFAEWVAAFLQCDVDASVRIEPKRLVEGFGRPFLCRPAELAVGSEGPVRFKFTLSN